MKTVLALLAAATRARNSAPQVLARDASFVVRRKRHGGVVARVATADGRCVDLRGRACNDTTTAGPAEDRDLLVVATEARARVQT